MSQHSSFILNSQKRLFSHIKHFFPESSGMSGDMFPSKKVFFKTMKSEFVIEQVLTVT